MNTSKRVIGGLLLASLAWAPGCGGVSDAEKQLGCNVPGSVAGSGGNGSTGTGGTIGTGGGIGTGGSGGAIAPDAGVPMDGPPSSACPPLTTLTLSVHIVMDATWPAGTATSAGSGKIHLWNLTRLNVSGSTL